MFDGSTLRDLRRRAGRTQREVAAATGIPVSVLSAYECGRRQPAFATAGRIIEALGYRVQFTRDLDPEVQGRRLAGVLTLAEALPHTPRPMARARR